MPHDDEELQEEIRAHLAMATQDRIADGADPTSARQASLKDFGNVTLIRDAARRVWVPAWLDGLRDVVSDARYAIRALARHPAFALTVVGVLTVGIAANAAVFTMIKSIALTPLSGVRNSSGLRVIYGETSAGRDVGLSYPDFQYLRERSTTSSGLYGHRLLTVTVGRGRTAHPASAEAVTGNYFDVLGVRAQLGRTLQMADEGVPGLPSVAVISDALWRRDHGGDPDIVGRTIEVNNKVLTIVGVTDPAYHGTIVSYDVDVYVPLTIAPDLGVTFGSASTAASDVLSDRKAAVVYVLGWLKPGVTMAEATAEIDAIWRDIARDRPADGGVTRLRLVPFRDYPGSAQATVFPLLVALSAMGLLVLVIACANIGGLVVVRGVSRRGELAVRLALGASRARIVRLLLVENLVLAIPGAIAGVVLATRVMPVLVGYAEVMAAPQRLFFSLQTDALLIAFAAVVAVASALVFGFAPALRSSRIDLVSVIRDEGPRGTTRSGLRSGLVVAQVAISLLLLVSAGLVTRSLAAAQQADRGYSADRVTSITLDLKANGYDEARGRTFYKALLDAARALPGAESASLAMYQPMAFLETRSSPVAIEGYEPERNEDVSMLTNVVAPQYFETLRVPIIAGREFADHDDAASAQVAVVNRTLADKFWGSATNAIGKKVRLAAGDWRTVVGVAADLKYIRIDEAPRAYVYVPFLQSYRPAMILHTRGSSPVKTLVEQARQVIATLDPELPIASARSLADGTRGALLFYTFMSSMLFVFGTAGIALAALGTYGLVSYSVKQSTHEIGIRMALGASGYAVVRGFLGRGLRLGVVGATIGTLAALGVGRLLRSVIYGVSPTDGLSFAQALAIVFAVVLAASLVPAWRASRTDPLKALRHP